MAGVRSKSAFAGAKASIKKNSGSLFVSAISAFEIGVKSQKGKLELPLDAAIWFERALRHHGIQELPVTSSIAIRATMLPSYHNDPCDRFIIATALQNSMPVVTCDALITQYHEVTVIW